MKPLVIYHANCADGFTAAWAVRQAMDADFHPGVYNEPPPAAEGRDLILVDFCYPPQVMLDLQIVARSILVLDHHKSAEAGMPDWLAESADNTKVGPVVVRLDGPSWEKPLTWADVRRVQLAAGRWGDGHAFIYALFDMYRSGAGIAWDVFHPGKARPALIDHVEDRDLWRFKLHGTREICAAVHSHPYTFAAWDALVSETTYSLYQQGLVLERARAKEVAEVVEESKRRMVIGHYDVPVASAPHTMVSYAGQLMAQGQPFAACYHDKASGRKFSLRSTVEGVDVSEVAKLYGGGGHARAAGFTVPRDHELARA